MSTSIWVRPNGARGILVAVVEAIELDEGVGGRVYRPGFLAPNDAVVLRARRLGVYGTPASARRALFDKLESRGWIRSCPGASA